VNGQKIEKLCDNCGLTPAYPCGERRDVCPTDRGDEVREYTLYLCDECYAGLVVPL
jgi:hypothetical protein